MTEIVVADTSPLIALSIMGLLEHLPRLFDAVYIPEEVQIECVSDLTKPMAANIATAIASGNLVVRHSLNRKEVSQLSQILDEGEASAIVLAKEMNSQILIDEKAGRSVAKREGLVCKGSLFCLVESKKKGLVDSAKERIDQLLKHGYYLDQSLIKLVLLKCNES